MLGFKVADRCQWYLKPALTQVPVSLAAALLQRQTKTQEPCWAFASYFRLRAGATLTSCGQRKFPEEATRREGEGILSSFTVLLALRATIFQPPQVCLIIYQPYSAKASRNSVLRGRVLEHVWKEGCSFQPALRCQLLPARELHPSSRSHSLPTRSPPSSNSASSHPLRSRPSEHVGLACLCRTYVNRVEPFHSFGPPCPLL